MHSPSLCVGQLFAPRRSRSGSLLVVEGGHRQVRRLVGRRIELTTRGHNSRHCQPVPSQVRSRVDVQPLIIVSAERAPPRSPSAICAAHWCIAQFRSGSSTLSVDYAMKSEPAEDTQIPLLPLHASSESSAVVAIEQATQPLDARAGLRRYLIRAGAVCIAIVVARVVVTAILRALYDVPHSSRPSTFTGQRASDPHAISTAMPAYGRPTCPSISDNRYMALRDSHQAIYIVRRPAPSRPDAIRRPISTTARPCWAPGCASCLASCACVGMPVRPSDAFAVRWRLECPYCDLRVVIDRSHAGVAAPARSEGRPPRRLVLHHRPRQKRRCPR